MNTSADYAKERAAYLRFVTENYARLFRTYARLADDASRLLFLQLILFRILGYEHVKLPSNTPAYWAAKDRSRLLESGRSPFADLPGAEGLAHFELLLEGQAFRLDCYRANVFYSFFLRQYFLERSGILVCPAAGDCVIDAGACFGDTAIGFARAVGATGRVHAFDMVDVHLRIVDHNIRQNPQLENIVVHPMALGDADRLGALAGGNIDPGFSTLRAETAVPMRSIDSLLAEGRIERVDFIKLDVEGHELPVLRGAAAAIRRFRPKLAISLYHSSDDYFRIPDYIHSLHPNYQMFLENYTITDGETVLYCIAGDDKPHSGVE